MLNAMPERTFPTLLAGITLWNMIDLHELILGLDSFISTLSYGCMGTITLAAKMHIDNSDSAITFNIKNIPRRTFLSGLYAS